ncbi:3,4-dihydroxy-2-butanone 4-phosphate synthase, RibB [Dillenia turbinata]|uniref:3,4-dihydroxy-2-butanone 4-phosphate synthase, RibB n=1 Tax=Dillenia turbinata TaxID=194707 RepID=A0AAN8ZAY0_9MAGN
MISEGLDISFLFKYRILQRAGHTEASVDLVMLTGLPSVSVLSSIANADDGSIASLPNLTKLGLEHSIPMVSITDLIRLIFVNSLNLQNEQVNIGNGQNEPVRVQSECLTGDIFGSAQCDCGNQLALAMQLIKQVGRGGVVDLCGHEGGGIDLGHKLRAYNLQDQGHDTVEANEVLGLPVDAQEHGIGAQLQQQVISEGSAEVAEIGQKLEIRYEKGKSEMGGDSRRRKSALVWLEEIWALPEEKGYKGP